MIGLFDKGRERLNTSVFEKKRSLDQNMINMRQRVEASRVKARNRMKTRLPRGNRDRGSMVPRSPSKSNVIWHNANPMYKHNN